MSYSVNKDPWMEHAIQIIKADDAVDVSLKAKNKDLFKFGRNNLVGTTKATLAMQPSGILHETFVSSNLINSIISTSGADTQTVSIEGHTSSDGLVFTFVVQTAVLTGQTKVTLSTPLARVSRVRNTSATRMAGTISVTQTDTYTAGVPATAAKVHIQITAGDQTSFKASTTLSSTDYLVITRFYADILEKTAASGEIYFETRLPGKVFITSQEFSASNNHRAIVDLGPYIIIKPNTDMRMTALADGASTPVSGGFHGALLTTA